jgi:uncharacterized protein (TIGR00730 family)
MQQENLGNVILSKEEMQVVARERIEEISKEFKEGFELLGDYPRSVTFFGSALFNQDNEYYKDARTLAGKIVQETGYSVLSGGGPGIMEAANRGAFEAGGISLGLTIELPTGQVTNKYLTKEVDSYYFFVRKVCLSFSAEAFIFYPGGFGTLDEFFELITLIQTKKIVGVPLICVGSTYWKSLLGFMHNTLIANGTVTTEDLKLFHITDDHREIIDIIKKSPVRNSLPFPLDNKPN